MARLAAAVAVLIAGSALSQVPDVGSSSDSTPTTPSAASTQGTSKEASAEAAPPSTEGLPALTITGGDTQSVPLDQAAAAGSGDKDLQVGQLGLFVSAPARVTGKLNARFLAASDGVTSRLQATTGIPTAEHPTLSTPASLPIEVLGQQPTALPLRLALPASAEARAASGLLTLRLRHGGEAVAAANVSITAQAPTVTVAPATVRVRVTRWWGPLSQVFPGDGLGGNQTAIQVLGRGADVVANGRTPPKTLLSSDQSSELRGQLKFEGSTENLGSGKGHFRISRANHTGSYSGTISLNPIQGGATAPATVEVQDGFIWPLFVLGVSSLLGGYCVQRQNLKSKRGLLQAMIKDAIKPYRANGKLEKAERLPLFEVDAEVLDRDQELPAAGDCKNAEPETFSQLARLYCRTWTAASDDEFISLTKDVHQGIAVFQRWRALAEQYRLLKAALDESGLPRVDSGTERADPAAKDTEDLLALVGSDPETDEATSKLVSRMREQRRILNSYGSLREEWNSLDKAQQDLAPDANPSTVYKPEANRDQAASQALDAALVLARDQLRRLPAPDVARTLAEKSAEEMIQILGFAPGEGLMQAFAAEAPLVPTAPAPPAPPVPPQPYLGDPRTSKQILSGLKRWDWVIALVTFLVLAVAFMLPKYASHTWGSWSDYLQLATLGFLGATATGGFVMNWRLFPGLRSYSADAPATGDKPPQGPDVAAQAAGNPPAVKPG